MLTKVKRYSSCPTPPLPYPLLRVLIFGPFVRGKGQKTLLFTHNRDGYEKYDISKSWKRETLGKRRNNWDLTFDEKTISVR